MLKRLLHFFVNYFFHTSIAAAFLYFNTRFVRGFTTNWFIFLSIFFATLAIYNYSNINIGNRNTRKLVILFSVVFTSYCLYNISFIETEFIVKSIIIVVLVGLYIFPIPKFRIRNVNYLKIFILATAWSLTSIIDSDFSNNISKFTFIMNFIFVFAISLPFDLRDAEIDKMKTISANFGLSKTSNFLQFLLLAFTFIQYQLTQNLIVFISVSLIYFAYSFYCKKLFSNNNYLAGLELLVIVNTIALLVF